MTAGYNGPRSISEQLGEHRPGPKVYDFAGGPDEAPEPKQARLPPWPGMIAHTRHGDDSIYLDASAIYGPGDPVDMRCGSCTPGGQIALDHDLERIIFMILHAPGCQAVNDLLQMAGVS